MWACEACTFHNQSNVEACTICNTPATANESKASESRIVAVTAQADALVQFLRGLDTNPNTAVIAARATAESLVQVEMDIGSLSMEEVKEDGDEPVCCISFEPVDVDTAWKCGDCRSYVSRDMMKMHGNMLAKDGRSIQPTCPSCRSSIAGDLAAAFIDVADIRMLRQRQLEKSAATDQSLRLCPAAGCGSVCKLKLSATRAVKSCPFSMHVHCNACGHNFCRDCNEHFGTMHRIGCTFRGGEASDVAAWASRKNRGSILTVAKTRRCGKCHARVEKSGGCNHFTCHCGYQFCWLCGREYTSGHFDDLSGCPGMQNTNFNPGLQHGAVRLVTKAGLGVVVLVGMSAALACAAAGVGLVLAAEVVAVPIAAGTLAHGTATENLKTGAERAGMVMATPALSVVMLLGGYDSD